MGQTKKDKRITVRLDPEAAVKLQDAKDKGYTTSQYINGLIKKSVVMDIGQCRKLIPCICELENLLEQEEDSIQKDAMRNEVYKIWQCLKSFQENT